MISVIRRIEQALGSNSRLVVVGGAVRDMLLFRAIRDWDLATDLVPEEVISRAMAFGIRAIPTGIKHGTVTLLVDKSSIEVTTFRGDGTYVDGRHPQAVTFGVSLEQDLGRRDFTINAMALPVSALGNNNWETMIIDPYGGLMDLKNKIIKTVGDPSVRFHEDGLRVLRACRFAAMLGFDVDIATVAAISKSFDTVKMTSIERVFAELTKLLCALEPERGLDILVSTKLLSLWLPEIFPMTDCIDNDNNRNLWDNTVAAVRNVLPSATGRWAAMLHNCGKRFMGTSSAGVLGHFDNYEILSIDIAKKILVRMHAGNSFIAAVVAFICHHNINIESNWDDSKCRRFLKKLVEDDLDLGQLILFVQATKSVGEIGCHLTNKRNQLFIRLNALAASNPPLTIKQLAIDSKDLIKIARRPSGPWLGALQRSLLESVLDDPKLNQTEDLMELAKDWLGKHY
jgi:tRNA nucleotidyltransferase/poly(A) polymerase